MTAGQRWYKPVVIFLGTTLLLAWAVVPIAWMILSSFKGERALTSATPTLIFDPTFENYIALFSGAGSLWPYVQNSLVAAGVSTLLSVGLGSLAGYGLSRTHFRGKQHLTFWIISTRMAPIAAIIVPLYILFQFVNLLGSVWGLVVAYMTFNLPFAIWLMTAFFSDLPEVLDEAATVDGATRWQTFLRVALPLTKPGIATTAILCFLFAWNDYAFALTFSGPDSQTIPIFAAQLVTQTGIDWGALVTIGTVAVLPMIFAGLLVRRYLVSGLTMGAVKG